MDGRCPKQLSAAPLPAHDTAGGMHVYCRIYGVCSRMSMYALRRLPLMLRLA